MNLINDWKSLWWRRWTTWLAAVAGGIASALIAAPSLLLGIIGFVPDDLRGFVAGAAGVIVFVVPVLLANIKQEKLDAHRTDV